MTAEIADSPLTVREAARALHEAREAVRRHGQHYARLRTGLDTRSTTRARIELGMAVLEFVNATVALAEAEDRADPVWAATRSRDLIMFIDADPAHVQCEQAWTGY
jgi:hypothetical protein